MPRFAVALVAALLLAACGGTRVDVPPPDAAASARALPEPAPSVVHLPLTLSLDSLVPKAETLVPRGDSNEDEWHPLGSFPVVGTLYVKEMWERGPLRMRMTGERLEVSTVVRYRARIAERACVPVAGCRWVPLAQCGHDGPMPSLEVGLATTVAWRPDWTVEPRTAASPVTAGVRCRLTRARVDVTDRVRQLVQKELDRAAPRLDAEIADAIQLRRRVESVWADLQEPIRADSGVYLVLRPESVAVALPPRADGATLSTTVTVRLRPRVMVGERPAVDTLPLPDFRDALPGDGFRIALMAELPYRAANELLNDELAGKAFEVQGRTVRVKGVRAYGSGERLVLAVRVGGDARGTLYLVGTPRYDPAAQVVTVPDLDFSVETRSVVAETAEWLLRSRLRERLRERARFAVGAHVEEIRRDVAEAMNRRLSRGVQLSGGVDSLRAVGVTVTPSSRVAVVEAGGHARVDITVR